VATRLAELGARVVALDRDEDALNATCASSERLIPHVADFAGGDTDELGRDVARRHGPIELIVNNVGIDTPESFRELDPAGFDRTFATNLRGPWFFTRPLVQDLIEREQTGAIVFISSLHDHVVRTHPQYSTSKAGVAMLVRELAHELGPHGIRVNAISPGAILTRAVSASADDAARVRRLVPLGRIGQPADIAAMAAVLLSDEWSAYVTGANVPVDGGLNLYTWSADE
jgi:3-oxoacyl-[acyl-carrier protein] reductase